MVLYLAFLKQPFKMRSALLLTLATCLLFSCKKKEPEVPVKDPFFGKHQYKGFVAHAIKTSDGNIVVCGDSNSYKAFIAKHAPDGSVVWRYSYPAADIREARALAACPDNEYMIVSKGDFIDSDQEQFCVNKIGANGELLWKKRYGTVDSDESFHIVRTYDDNYVIAGYSKTDIYLLKIKGDGTKIWANKFTNSTGGFVRDIIETADHSYVVAGNTNTVGNPLRDRAYVLKVSESGSKMWDNSFAKTNGDKEANAIVELPSGEFVLCGEQFLDAQHISDNQWQAFVLKMSATGQLIWDKDYGEQTSGEMGYDIISDGGTGFVICGRKVQQENGSSNAESNMHLFAVSADGTEKWTRKIASTQYEQLNHAIRLSNGNYVLIGSNQSGSTTFNTMSYYYLVGVNANGEM